MEVDGYFFTKEHVGWMGVEHRSTHMTKPPIKTCTLFIMLCPNVWKRASVTKYLDTCAAVQELRSALDELTYTVLQRTRTYLNCRAHCACTCRQHRVFCRGIAVFNNDYISRVPRLMFITSCQQCFSSINLCTAGGKCEEHIKRANRFCTDFCVLRKRISTNRD